MSDNADSTTTTTTTFIQSSQRIDMKSSATERINQALNELKTTPIESHENHTDAVNKLQNVLEHAGISYHVISVQITPAERARATEVLRTPQLLLAEYERYRKQPSTAGNNSKVPQDIVTPPGTEDIPSEVLQAFPMTTEILSCKPVDILMHYYRQLKDQPGWMCISKSRDAPYQSWESTYSYLIQYLLSLEISTSSLLIKGISLFFDPKKRYTTLPTSVHQVLASEDEKARTHFSKIFHDRNSQNKIRLAKDAPTDWEEATYTVMRNFITLIKPGDANPNYLGNIMAATKFEQCISMLPDPKTLNTQLLLGFQKQHYQSVAEIEQAVEAWHHAFRTKYSGSIVIQPEAKSQHRKGYTHNQSKVETSQQQSRNTTNPPPGNGKDSKKDSKSTNPKNTPKTE